MEYILERLHSNHEKKGEIYKSRGDHKAFNRSGITLFVKFSKSPKINNNLRKIILTLAEYYQICTYDTDKLITTIPDLSNAGKQRLLFRGRYILLSLV